MKRITLLVLTAISIFVLSACQDNEKVKEEDVLSFLKEYKGITHNVDNSVDVTLTTLKPYLNDEWYKINERDRRTRSAETSQNASYSFL
ncbi:hypothetical protein FC756_12265 [Lysinibacillus mangiferihumi]|uniref:Uncharacterized protein n=1 Tax=Lysinibacillus mangiferihumi TaxID=1130819 RepID=A0A4U2Z2A3_9BACI|nr:hypothetical protein [Lysinibacillus mangiferihumi]TKI67814.1 hypothetical protein FC756_12265 [Lysinibacillus mangiferihumi]